MKHPCSRLLAAGCAGFVSLACFGQSAPSFTSQTSASGPPPSHVYAVDVNNDGVTDIIQDTANPGITGSLFTVSINNGNGTFKAPVTYTINSNTWTPLTCGDFNNDGHVDVVAVLPGTNQVAVYLGNGDGTFQAPITTTLDLPTGTTFSAGPQSTIAAADFNHDGNVDLVAAAYQDFFSGPWGVYLLEGDGSGHFNNPRAIYNPTSGWTVQTILAGDFDTDDNADVALLESLPCSSGGVGCSSNVLALFGDGGTNFEAVDVTTVSGNMSLGAADLNNDGATDLYGVEYGSGNAQLAVFPGHFSRRFSYYFTPIPASAPNVAGLFAVADFNGAGSWALAGLTTTYPTLSTPNNQIVYFLNAGTPTPTIVTGPSPAGVAGLQSPPVAGNFNGDLKPDIAINVSTSGNTSTSTLAAGLNANTQGSYGACNYPASGQGIRVCPLPSPSTAGPFTFAASANSFGQLRKMELWVDGVKLAEQHFTWGQSAYFDWRDTSPLSSGTHNGTIFAADIDNTLQRSDFTFTVH